MGPILRRALTWFTASGLTPLHVWLAQVAHLLVVVGLLAAIWRRAIGVTLTAAALVCFFGSAGWPRAMWLVALTVAPVVLFALSDAMRGSTARSSATR